MSVVPMCLCLTLSDAYVIRLSRTSVKHFSNMMFVRAVDDGREAELTQDHTAGVATLTATTIQDDRRVFFNFCQLFRHMARHEFSRRNVDGAIDMTCVVFEWFARINDELLHTIYCIVCCILTQRIVRLNFLEHNRQQIAFYLDGNRLRSDAFVCQTVSQCLMGNGIGMLFDGRLQLVIVGR